MWGFQTFLFDDPNSKTELSHDPIHNKNDKSNFCRKLFIILIIYNKSLKEIYKCVMFRKSLVVQELQFYTVYMIIYISIYRLHVICIYYMHIYIYIYIYIYLTIY